jgi:hypothetical protein
VTWTLADEAALATAAPALRANRRVALGSLGVAILIPVVGVALLVTGVSAPRLSSSGGGGEWSSITHRGAWFVTLTNGGRTTVTVTGIATFDGDGTPTRGVSDVVMTPADVAPGATVDVHYTFLVDCSAYPDAPQNGLTYRSGSMPYTEITVTGTWPWHTARTLDAGPDADTLASYCTSPG